MSDYAACETCGQVMGPEPIGCTVTHGTIAGEEYARVRFGEDCYPLEAFGRPCHDCNVLVGMVHHFGCDMEQCPRCGGQLLSCDCDAEESAPIPA